MLMNNMMNQSAQQQQMYRQPMMQQPVMQQPMPIQGTGLEPIIEAQALELLKGKGYHIY